MIWNQKNKKEEVFVILDGKVPFADLRPRKKEWTEESFIEYTQAGDFYGDPASLKVDFDFRKINQILAVLFIGILIMGVRSFYLQVIRGDYYRQMAEGNRIRVQTVKAQRGLIYDRNMIQLVSNEPKFTLAIIPSDLPKDLKERDKVIFKVSEIAKTTPEKIEEEISKIKKNSKYYFQPVIIEDYLEYNNAILYTIESEKLPGVSLQVNSLRNYKNSIENGATITSLSHLLGYVGKITQDELEKFSKENYLYNDFIGKEGLEAYYENELKGIDGSNNIEFDALGKEKNIISQQEPKAGKNLVLTIDIKMQQKLEEILQGALNKFKKQKGSAIIINPKNGEILAMVSLPSYDNNIFSKGIKSDDFSNLINDPNKPLLNRSISGEYPAGSTFKPIVASAALEEGLINEYTTYYSSGGIRIGQWFFPDWLSGGHGATNVKKALAQSINTFFYIIGGGYQSYNGLGHKKIDDYAAKFGFGKKLGVDLIGEKGGFLPTSEWKLEAKNEVWYIGDTYHLAIGQGDLLVTPLQIASEIASFANDGTVLKPHLLKEFQDSQDKTSVKNEIEILNKEFISPKNINIVNQGLRQAVTSGSARSLLGLPITTAGKTGTAQWNLSKDPHAWFICYAPYEEPELAISVLIEEGKEGSSTAITVAKDFLSWYFGAYKIQN